MKSTGKKLLIFGFGLAAGIGIMKYGKQAKAAGAEVIKKIKEKARAKDAECAKEDENPEA